MEFRHVFYWMLRLPPAVAQKVVRLQQLINRSYRGPSKPMAQDRLHTTLLPLGSYEHRIPPEVLRVVLRAGALLEVAPFRVCFDTLQSRGPRHQVGTVELAGHGAGVLPLFHLHSIDDTVVDYMFNMAGALQSIGGPENRDKAQLLYEGVMRAKPDRVYGTWNLAEIYLSKNDREGATRLYDNIIRIDFGLVDQPWIRKSWIFAANCHSNEDRKNVLEALRQAFQKTSNDILICKQLRREEPTYRWLNHDSEFIAITETCRGWPN